LKGKADNVPAALLWVRGIPALLFQVASEGLDDIVGVDPSQGSSLRQPSKLASAILERSQEFRSQASDTRLHNKVRTLGSSSNRRDREREHESMALSSVSSFKNLGKASKVLAERKKKLDDSKLNDIGVRIAGTLWESEKNKITQVT
jgi:hypothetical protein